MFLVCSQMAQLRPKRMAQLEAIWVAQLRPFYPPKVGKRTESLKFHPILTGKYIERIFNKFKIKNAQKLRLLILFLL